MNNDNYNFWKMAYNMKAIDISMLRQAVITKENPFGEITEEQFKEISGVDFITKPITPVTPTAPITPTTPTTPTETPIQPTV